MKSADSQACGINAALPDPMIGPEQAAVHGFIRVAIGIHNKQHRSVLRGQSGPK
jgi:hypothetical protein